MSVLPSNVNQALRFITDEPDWAKGVLVTDARRTSIITSRAGLEVRHRQRLVPRIQIEYTVSGLTNEQAESRLAQSILDSRAPLVVPMWTDIEFVAADTSGPNHTDLAIGNARRPGFFKAGDYVYWNDGSTTQFRSIASLTDSTNFVLDTVGSPEAMAEDDPVYPCLVCEQVTGEITENRFAPESRELKLIFKSIEVPYTTTSYANTIPVEGTSVTNPDVGS